MQTVYGDILFFVNFCMDFQCLFLTAKLLRRPFSLLRGAIFSAFGALYACVALFLAVSGIWAFLADCGVCFLMCVGVFCERNTRLRRVLTPFILYFGVSFAVGGVMSGIASLLSHVEAPLGTDTADISSSMFFLLAVLGGAATFLWGRFCQRRANGMRADLILSFEGKRLSAHGMVDTANLLRDPVGGKLVALLDNRVAQALLPEEILSVARLGEPAALADLPSELARRVRLIPADTATGKGLLFAVVPDSAVLHTEGGEYEVELLIAPVPLSTVGGDDIDVLLPAALITE